MCGICGIVHLDGRIIDPESLARMTDSLIHRGPDDEGRYLSPDGAGGARAGFGFRRLSIIDVASGHQPMRFGRKVVVLNGEILNYRDLREECLRAGDSFATTSDTEVLLHLFARHGERALEKLSGMYAFAIWDEETREIFLARDRLGIKPLYYYRAADGRTFVFASEMKALLLSGEVPFSYDPVAVRDFFSYRFVPAPHTVLRDVRKVPPGRFLRLRGDGHLEEGEYWTLRPEPEIERNEDELASELLERMTESVRRNIVSDVPVGAFLSGGVDSSLMVALMERVSPSTVRTFSIGFRKEAGIDESPVARRVAEHVGSEHHELILGEEDLGEAARALSRMNEPVADPTILPTAILSRFARREVKVALSGEGGDELFAGYNRYKTILYSRWIRGMPRAARGLACAILRRGGRGECYRAIPDVLPRNWFLLNRDFTDGMLDSILRDKESAGYLDAIAAAAAGGASAVGGMAGGAAAGGAPGDPLRAVLDLERRTSLADRLLMKVDMASMGESLEARPPYLDHDLVEFAFRVPSRFKIRSFQGKHILRKAAERVLPREICRRRKHGFIVPIVKWMRAGGSFDHLDSLLDDRWIRAAGIFEADAIARMKERLRAGEEEADGIAALWPVIVLGCWARGIRGE